MKKGVLLLAAIVCCRFIVLSQVIEFSEPVNYPESCTSIMVGKSATTDGSVITSHTCDGNYRTWMNIVPAAVYNRDTVETIYMGKLHTLFIKDMNNTERKGTIPQVKSTYQYLNTAYPCLNEKQLAIGETTISGRKELVNNNGMFTVEELEAIALQRCTTARDAIRLMGDLIAQYGYCDWGECLTIADTKEVWHFEVFGEGLNKVGGVWAAVRIPDDHVGVSANIPRISGLNLKDKDNYMASANVFDVAKELGYWDGKAPFCFWKAYGGGKKAFDIREYFIFSQLAPSLNLSYDAEELPFSIKPEKKISVAGVLALFRQTYEGTEWDSTRNLKVVVKKKENNVETVDTIVSPAANPWMSTDMIGMLNGIKDSTVVRKRQVAVPQCSYAHVIQLRDWLPDAVGGVAWLSFDNPAQSPRIPIFAGTKSLPVCFDRCGQGGYDEKAIVWKFRKTNKLATVRWGLTRDKITTSIARFEAKGLEELPFVEQQYKKIAMEKGEDVAKNYLTNYTADFAGATILRWEEMSDEFWKMFARGF